MKNSSMLTLIKVIEKSKHSTALYRCECGNEKILRMENVNNLHTKSCGCYLRSVAIERFTKHGMKHTPEYEAWCDARKRCMNRKTKNYSRYGGRGIAFLFGSFEAFYSAVGPRPSDEHSLDRVDNDGNYEAGNVKWSTAKEQAANRRARQVKKHFDVYLCGSMGGRTIGTIIAERQEAINYCREYGLTYYNPAGDEHLESADPGSSIPTNYDISVMEKFVKKDDYNLDRCRFLVHLNGDGRSDGCAWEMARAYYRNGTPIILVAPQRAAGKLVQFSNLKAFYLAYTIKEALYQVKLLKGVL